MTMVRSDHMCHVHHVNHEFEVDESSAIVSIEEDLGAWKSGRLYLQDLKFLNADQREMLLTGTCQEAWDTMFPKERCSEDCDGSTHEGLFCN